MSGQIPPVGRRSDDSGTAPDGSEVRLLLDGRARHNPLQYGGGQHRRRSGQPAGSPSHR